MSKHIVIDARIRRSSTGRYVDRMIEHLQVVDTKNHYTILLAPDDTWQPSAKNFVTVTCKYGQFSLNPLQQIGFSWQLYRLRADIVHFPLNNQPVLYWKKTIVSTLDLTMLYFTRPGNTPLPIFWVKMALFRFLFWFSNRKAAAIITISHYVEDELVKKYRWAGKKTTTTHNASEPPLPGKAAQPAGVTKPFIFYVGTAFPHKNLEKLIEAFEIIKRSHPDLQLVLVGKKEKYYTWLEEKSQTSPVSASILFTGFIEDAELKWLYQNTEAYVFPSLSEGFGLPGLEAMVHGCPVVSSNATCLPEVYGDAAEYFDPTVAEDIARAVEAVIDDPKRHTELIKRGAEQAAKYSWRRMAEQTLAIYNQVLGK